MQSAVPILLLSGAADIQTPPELAEHALASLENARHIIIPHATHSVMLTPCGGSLIEQFLLGGTLDALDTSCVASAPNPQW